MRLNGHRLHHANRDHVTRSGAGKITDLDRVIPGIGVLQIGQTQLGCCRPIDEIAVTTPLICQVRVRQRVAGNNFQCNRPGEQAVGAFRHGIQFRSIRQFMVQLHRTGFTADTIDSNQIGHPFISSEHHLAILTVTSTVIVAGHLIDGIPARPGANLVDCQNGVEVTVIGVDLGRATLVRCEGCPRGGTTRGAGMVRFTRILGRPRGVVNRGTGE